MIDEAKRAANLLRVRALIEELGERDGVKVRTPVGGSNPMAHLMAKKQEWAANPVTLSEEARAKFAPIAPSPSERGRL